MFCSSFCFAQKKVNEKRDYDSAGNLTTLTYVDTLGIGKKWMISYKGGHPFAKWPYNGCTCDVVYYPESKLHISPADFSHNGNFIFDTVWEEVIVLQAADGIEIKSAIRKNVDILDRRRNMVSMPVHMKKGDTVSWVLRYHARAATYSGEDTIQLLTSDTTIYKIYRSSYMSHLSADNIGETRTITLSASKDKYLWIDKFGVEGYACIKSACIAGVSGKQDCISFDKEIDKLNISKYEPGNYELIVVASSFGELKNRVITLVIRK